MIIIIIIIIIGSCCRDQFDDCVVDYVFSYLAVLLRAVSSNSSFSCCGQIHKSTSEMSTLHKLLVGYYDGSVTFAS